LRGVRSGSILAFFRPLWTDNLLAKPYERWAELAKRMHETEHAGDDTTKVVVPVSLYARAPSPIAA
jgi:hypothetical protein